MQGNVINLSPATCDWVPVCRHAERCGRGRHRGPCRQRGLRRRAAGGVLAVALLVTSCMPCLGPREGCSLRPPQAALLVPARLSYLGGAADERLARILLQLLTAGDYSQRPPGVKACVTWALAHFCAAAAGSGNRCFGAGRCQYDMGFMPSSERAPSLFSMRGRSADVQSQSGTCAVGPAPTPPRSAHRWAHDRAADSLFKLYRCPSRPLPAALMWQASPAASEAHAAPKADSARGALARALLVAAQAAAGCSSTEIRCLSGLVDSIHHSH